MKQVTPEEYISYIHKLNWPMNKSIKRVVEVNSSAGIGATFYFDENEELMAKAEHVTKKPPKYFIKEDEDGS